jgi:hypothetical protein
MKQAATSAGTTSTADMARILLASTSRITDARRCATLLLFLTLYFVLA